MQPTFVTPVPESSMDSDITTIVQVAREAMRLFASADQETTDYAVTALAWSLYEPTRARFLAEMAVKDTGMGNVADKIIKNQRKTFGTLRDLSRVKSVGVIESIPEKGIVKYAKPVGVVAAVTPSTNPAATPVNKAMMAIKGRNTVIIAPSPAGYNTTACAVEGMRSALAKVGAPPNLVQLLPLPTTKQRTQWLMQVCDLVVVTGSENNVKSAYRSGTPAIGVGVGNVPAIIDSSDNMDDTAQHIAASKTFDNATSCSSENALVIVDTVFDEALTALQKAGAYRVTASEKKRIQHTLWRDGKLNRELLATGADQLTNACRLSSAAGTRFFLVDESGVGPNFPFSDEKLSLFLTLYRAADFATAVERVKQLLNFKGRGHSIGIHTTSPERARHVAEILDTVRVLVNMAHTFGNGGGFNSGLNFTLSMGCGTWQGNSISENLNYRHFLNITHLVTPIPEDKPSEQELFGKYLTRYGY